ncbi:hypothetical protein FAGAP_4487 [Fusarium agapanthi]|uniref:Uncharacterized protein n=1 Tax=Fusarium agapanthi TaxID=1803897 RepID=A0A9P5BCG2_9HYPO|nr:hypothetical protein FAGAP_4487 [Fusarium agapanthi]
MSSPMFEVDYGRQSHLDCFPMVPGKASASCDVSARTFTTYRIRKNPNFANLRHFNEQGIVREICFSTLHAVSRPPGPKPHDASFGYLVFEVMDDHKPHDLAWLGVPSVGQYVNFDEISCFSVRFEWFDEGQQTWLSMPMSRYNTGRAQMSEWVNELDVEKVLTPWRVAMDTLQVLEGRVYTEPLEGSPKKVSVLHARKLETDYLAQKYRWVSRESSAPRPVPAYAIWDDNFRLVKRLFETNSTHIATTGPYEMGSDLISREVGDRRAGSIVYRPCTFTAFSAQKELWGTDPPVDAKTNLSMYPTGPHQFLAYQNSMTLAQLCEATRVPVPLPEHLVEEAEAEEAEEGGGDGAQDDGDVGSGQE